MFPQYDWLYSACIIVGVVVCIFVVLPLVMKKYGMSKKANDFYSTMGLVAIAAGIGGGIFFQFMYDLIGYGFKLPKGYSPGMTFLGGLITGAGTFLLGARFIAKPEVRNEMWIILRAFAPCVCIAHAFGRIGCFCAGCCYGKETDSFLGVLFPGDSHKVLPTQLIESAFLFALFAICFLYTDKSMIIYLFSYGIFRFTLEFFRGDDRGFTLFGVFSPSQLICMGLIITGAVLLYFDITKGIFKRYIPPDKTLPPPDAPAAEGTPS